MSKPIIVNSEKSQQDSKDDKLLNNKTDVKATNEKMAEENAKRPKEIGGRKGPEPTRYGDWELKGRCIDF